MILLSMQVQAHTDGPRRSVSVWVDVRDPTQARILASARLAEVGWVVVRIDNSAETNADDYFRPCPSQDAFLRAKAEAVAWRFDDE